MSGGVDSSVTAALMADQGFEVVGVTLQLYDDGAMKGRVGSCCAGQDIADARRVAQDLAIPHYVLDYETKFRESVIDDFVQTYAAGETPIPCVRCNQTVKFRDLLAAAKDLGADFLATGHYVRRVDGDEGPELHQGADPSRDQSYFMFATTREQLEYLRFPLGDMDKTETRAIADRFGLKVAAKPDSQDICFVPDGDYARTIERLMPEAAVPGDIVHVDGRVLGQHQGIIHYTVGQRRGLGLGGGDPLYVVRLEPKTNRVIVGDNDALAVTKFRVRDMNWLTAKAPTAPIRGEVKVRSTRPPVSGTLTATADGGAMVELDQPEYGVAPGQACVVYRGTRVLGGGWITPPPIGADGEKIEQLQAQPA
ncbi:MAG: tRNA 2-thiouridine(34) synthase MnmA [Alphaproteobacteria bacterium]|nr:tRNA 2-thiouridine(34) synthase MnmA [Alphaproteobacteria bacterium]MBT5861141.1 tRNA 2-thiouridine(34) synthase MnmA [Alphaproteobacteria bacterium]